MIIGDIENELMDIGINTKVIKNNIERIVEINNLVKDFEECLINDDIDLELDIKEEILSQVSSGISDDLQAIDNQVSDLKDTISNIDCEEQTNIGYERQEHYIEYLEEIEQEISNIDVDVEYIVDNVEDIKQRLDNIIQLADSLSKYDTTKKKEYNKKNYIKNKELKNQVFKEILDFEKVLEQVRTILNNNPKWGRSKVMKELINLPENQVNENQVNENQVKRALAIIKGSK